MVVDSARNISYKKVLSEDLMRRVADGNKEAFELLYISTQHAVYCMILSIVKNPTIAEDLMQDTYISVRRSIKNYTPQYKPMAWIFTIAKNLAYMELRKRNFSELTDEILEDDTRSFDNTTQAADRIVLNKALALLGEKERQIVLLHAVAGLKFREIATTVESPLGSVLSTYNRSIKKLQKAVSE